ncbi:hypothetical protein K1719_026261 [Acacia pycnantha]|nr:hypothetical protein K1719_026261 [Acacia pycnantha]
MKEKERNRDRNQWRRIGKELPLTHCKDEAVFVKVDQLKPGTNGHNLVVKVVSANTVLQKGRPSTSSRNPCPTLIAECLIGDETGTILFTARNEQAREWSCSVREDEEEDFSCC